MHTNIFIFFFRSVFQQYVVPSASHIASLVPGRPRKPSYTYCLPSWVSTSLVQCQGHPWTWCRIPFKPQMGSNPYLFNVLANILSQYPNLDSSSYPHTGKGILLVLGFFFNYSNMKDMRMLIRAMYHVLIEWSSQCRIEDLKKSLRIRSSAANTMWAPIFSIHTSQL